MQLNSPYTAQEFCAAIKSMNEMYELPISESPKIYASPEEFIEKIKSFHITLRDEVNELLEVASDAEHQSEVQILTNMADLLGDVVVYCFSEAQKYGIPLMEVLRIIMLSNQSKLGEDGRPIKNEHGKFLKGPNYWKPEPKIMELLEAHQLKEVPSIENPTQSEIDRAVAVLTARSEISTEVPNCSALFAEHALAMLDVNQFNHQLREHLTTNQVEQLAMTLAFNTAATYRMMGANGIACAYDDLYKQYSGRGDKLDDSSCYIMWQFLGYDLTWEAIANKLVELKVYG